MNEAAAETQNTEGLIVYCLSHMICNTGDKADFVLLQLVWTYLQKVALSTIAQDEWEDMTGMKCPTFLETHWFSKYDVLEEISCLFPDLLAVTTRISNTKISPKNSVKLLNLILDPLTSRMLQIQLSAYVKALFPLCNLCNWLETDTMDVAFRVGERLDEFQSLFLGGNMMTLPSTNRLVMHISFVSLYSGSFTYNYTRKLYLTLILFIHTVRQLTGQSLQPPKADVDT